jgi:hypothetical protein
MKCKQIRLIFFPLLIIAIFLNGLSPSLTFSSDETTKPEQLGHFKFKKGDPIFLGEGKPFGEVIELLGEGGFGTIYKVRLSSGEEFAVKLLKMDSIHLLAQQ